jgi:PAS domain S-box-containing protein
VSNSIVIGLMQNIAILLTFSMLYDYFWSKNEKLKNIFFNVGAGIVLGGIGIVLILTPWHFIPGIFFDTRSVMLSISGLFFGPIATITAMAITSIYRWNMGGGGALMGIAVIFTSGSIGILWKYFRPGWHKKNGLWELAAMGVLVHGVMISCTVFLPSKIIWETLNNIVLPTMLIYPVATVLLGALMLNHTENWENRKALKISEKRFRSIIEQATDAIFITDLEGNILDTNQQACKNLGYSMNELLKINITDLDTVYNSKERLMDVFQKMNSNECVTFETEHCRKNTNTFPVEVNASMIDLDGSWRMIGFVRNISERKQAEEKLKQERILLRTLIDNLPVTIYVKDVECRKIIANRLDLDFMGAKSEQEVLGKTDYELFDNEIAKRGYEDDLRVINSGQPVINREENFSDAHGFERWLLTSKIPIYNENGEIKGLVGIGRDITEQKLAQDKILKLSKGIEQSPVSIEITDINGIIEYVNPKLCETTGYSAEEFIGQHARILKSDEMPKEIYSDLWETISSGNVWKNELINKRKDGTSFWESVSITSIKNEKGIITNYIAIKEDINVRKQMEVDLIAALEKAEESDRLKSAFLANMSHEIRTPLNSIIGFSELLGDPDFEPEQRAEFIKTIVENGNGLLVIISDIMDFSMLEAHQITIRNETFSTKKLLNELLNDFRNKASQNGIKLIFDESNNQPDIPITSDYYRIKQILNNLIGNAIKFTHIGNVEIGFRPINEFVEFHVKDTGIGIAPKYHQAIFDRFRQVDNTKTRKYGGNGLGLAITKNLVELLGGTIWVKSEPEKYSDFFFTIPVNKL